MSKLKKCLAAVLLSVAVAGNAQAQQTENAPTVRGCNIGPVSMMFGNSPWLVYSCQDKRTVIIVSAPGNEARPFYFAFVPTEAGYQLVGEGTGNSESTAAAFNDLRILSANDVADLVALTQQQ